MRNLLSRTKLPVVILCITLLFIITGCDNGNEETIADDTPTTELEDTTEVEDTADVVDVDWDFYNLRAAEFVFAVASGDFDSAIGMFDEAMSEAVDAEALQGMWEEVIISLAGEFITIHEIQNAVVEEFYISTVIMRHEHSGFGWNVVFSEDGLIAGLSTLGTLLLPDAENIHTTDEAERNQREGFVDYHIIVGEGTMFPLRGILSIPDDVAEQVPAVVIAHGSGGSDLDGTLPGAGSTPYREIAEFLAANGIAVIRYDKRTFAHGRQVAQEFGGSLTVWEETIEDILLATEMLRADPRIDSDRIYIIGHSLGGVLAPRIHAEGGDFAGLILMTATTRPILELFVEQTRASIDAAIYLGLAEEADFAGILDELDELEELLGRLADMSEEEAKTTPVPMHGIGTMAYYYKNQMAHPFEKYAQDVTVPILIMQGGRDFQILPDVDFVLLQELFAGQNNVSFRLYDDLNHAFMPTTAENFMEHAESIMSPGHVYTQVLQDIVDWILG